MDTALNTIRTLIRQASNLTDKDAAEALRLAQQAQTLLAGCPDAQPGDKFDCLKIQGSCLDNLSRPDQALPLALQAKALAEQLGDSHRLAAAHLLLGMIYWHIDEYPTAMDYYLGGLKHAQAVDEPTMQARFTNGLGLVQYGLGNYAEALVYFQKYLQLAQGAGPIDRAHAHNNVAYVLHMLGRNAEALDYGKAALAVCEQAGTTHALMETLHSVGAICLALDQADDAHAYLLRGLAVAREFGSALHQIPFVLEIGRIYLRRGQLDKAEQEALEVLEIAQRINSITNLSLIYERLVEIYRQKGDSAAALKYFAAYHETYKKIFNDQSDRRVKQLDVLHQVETAKRDAEIYRLRMVELHAANEMLAERSAQLEAALAEVRRLNADLERRVELRTAELSARTADLAVAKEAAEAANRAKTAFLNVMGHELRTPLNGIFLAAEMLRGDKSRLVEHSDLPDHILTSGRRLLNMVTGVLEYSSAEAPPSANTAETKLALQEAVLAVENRAGKLGVTLVSSLPGDLPAVRCEETRFAGILRRLLENALNFTPGGGRVEMTAEGGPWALPGGERPAIMIRVTDTGAGLSPENLERIFEPFVQLEASYLDHSLGAGLGLTLARRQAEACGGRLWAESAGPGRGSTFTLVLPAAGADQPQALTSAKAAP